LELTLTALVAIDGEQTRYAVRTFERTMEVTAVPVARGMKVKRFFESNWQWLATTLLIPLAAWGYRRRASAHAVDEARPQRPKAKV
jgi:hypothetical protein